jgi:hypothetical protein
VGLDQNAGRNFVFNDYVDLMVSSKIHIMAKRDALTDHYRLMEALTGVHPWSSPMSLSSWPRDCGQVILSSRTTACKLCAKAIFYYLQHERRIIVQRGWEICHGISSQLGMSWKRAIFGRPQTLGVG